jgi:hypothetical protein
MNGPAIRARKSTFAWVVIVLLCLSILGELLTATTLFLTQNPSLYYGRFASLNALAVLALVLDLSLSCLYLYKLLVFDLDVLLWTHIWFGYSVVRSAFSIFADVASQNGTAYANLAELIVVCVVWTLFYLHLKRRFPITRDAQ